MSIIIQFNSPFGQSAISVPSNQCHLKKNVKLEMVTGINNSDVPGMTDDSNSIDVASSSVFSTTARELKISNNHIGSYFGLPYQDHNYGAPPPPTPPSHSPIQSPVPVVPLPDEDTTLSVISNSTNEEVQEESVTRCICGFEHDDEYMISCDNCLVWQHVDCMGLDRSNMPDTYLCDQCEPRKLDRHKAKLLQSRKKNSLTALKPTTPITKQALNFNNCLNKDKKKPIGQNIEKWASSQKSEFREASQRFNYSSDSEDGLNKNLERRPKTRSKRRKREEEKAAEVCEQTSRRKSKKHGKERMEAKRSRLRRIRGKSKESTSTADEEAQDAWEYNLEWCEKNFEDAISNQYTPEIQRLARSLSAQGFEKRFLEQMRSKQCHAYDDGKRKQLVCLRDLPRDSPLIEYKGKFLLASQFHDIHPLYNKRLYPYVLFYVLDQDEICIDASIYGNDARFVRRSCKPNAEIRHMVYNGKLHLYLTATRVIFREDEVTIPLIIHPNDSIKDIECACSRDDCLVKPKKKNGTIEVCHEKKRRTRRSTVTADEDSNHSVDIKPSKQLPKITVADKPKQITIKSEPIEIPPPQVVPVETIAVIPKEFDTKNTSDYESEDISSGKKKPTREERKMESWIRYFAKMDEAEKRKQIALEKQKSHNPKSEILDEKLELELQKEEKPCLSLPEYKDEDKTAPQTPTKSKKGKRRRGSGTPSRRRTRTNSGGSDLLSFDEASPTKCAPPTVVDNIVDSAPIPATSPPPPVSSGLISPTPTVAPVSPHVLKTKRSLMNEWLQEKSETVVSNPVSSPLPIHTEMKWNTSSAVATCYVRCTKDAPHSSGISAHLRRIQSGHKLSTIATPSSTTGQGSAKKRWLRQAMLGCEMKGIEIKGELCEDSSANIDSECLSPNCHIDNEGDVITPLKKRRQMRESIESQPSPQSPSTATSVEDTDATTVSNSLISDNSNEHITDTIDDEIAYMSKEQESCESTDNLIQKSNVSTESDQTEINQEKDKDPVVSSETYFNPISVLLNIASGFDCVIEKSSENFSVESSNNNIENRVEQSLKQSDLMETGDVDDLFPITISETSTITQLNKEITLPDKSEIAKNFPINHNNLNLNEIKIHERDSIVQEHSQNFNAASIISSSSFVNNAAHVQSIASSPNQISCSSMTNITSYDMNEPLKATDNDSLLKLSNASLQNEVIFSNEIVNCFIPGVDVMNTTVHKTVKFVNSQDGDSTNSCLTDPPNQTVFSDVSSSKNVENSNSYTSIQINSDNFEKVASLEASEKTLEKIIDDEPKLLKTENILETLPDKKTEANTEKAQIDKQSEHVNLTVVSIAKQSKKFTENVLPGKQPDITDETILLPLNKEIEISADMLSGKLTVENILVLKESEEFETKQLSSTIVDKVLLEEITVKETSLENQFVEKTIEENLENQSEETTLNETLLENQSEEKPLNETLLENRSEDKILNETVLENQSGKKSVNETLLKNQSELEAAEEILLGNQSENKVVRETLLENQTELKAVEEMLENQSELTTVRETLLKNQSELKTVKEMPTDKDSGEITVKETETIFSGSNVQSIVKEDPTPDTKICASATQKRKVSLSEYRMRMRENIPKATTSADTVTKNLSPTSVCAISFPDTLPEQLTLAPLPLFDKIRARKPLAKQSIHHKVKKNKEDTKEKDKDGDVKEHRENLNERLKREFGFDVSEGNSSAIPLKTKFEGTHNTDVLKLLGARSSTPPPPPPPRPPRPQRESINVAIPARFNFTLPPPFPRPRFIVPQQVPNASYLPAQPPILPSMHPINTNTTQCNLRPPLIPSTHRYNPSMTLLRPPQHDYTPVNAQRFAALVQQPPPPPPHKSYLHVYPSGLYK